MSAALPAEAFEALLARLRTDGQRADVAYERLRTRLVALLRLHVPADAESLADVALDRMARRIHEGTIVENVQLYALGIGRMLVLEAQGRAARERQARRELALAALEHVVADPEPVGRAADSSQAPDEERMLAAVTACLDRLGKENADMMLAYYSGDGAERIERRRSMADELGISINALRNRALRLRVQLERCARRWLMDAPTPHVPGDESANRTLEGSDV